MTTLSVAAVAQPTNNPPRVQVTVTDTGTSPAITSATVTRTDNSGRTSIVRTSDGGPLPLVTSGTTRVGTVYDYEAPYGVPVTYSTSEQPANVSASTTLSSNDVWLVHVGVPDRSLPIDLRASSSAEESRAVNAGVFYPMGRRNAVVISDGQRNGRQSSLVVSTDTLAEFDAIDSLVDDAGVLLLNVPQALGLGIATSYIFVQDVTYKRLSDIGSMPDRDIVMPYVVVDPPVGGSQAQWSWSDVVTKYATWQDVLNANATWAALQAPTT